MGALVSVKDERQHEAQGWIEQTQHSLSDPVYHHLLHVYETLNSPPPLLKRNTACYSLCVDLNTCCFLCHENFPSTWLTSVQSWTQVSLLLRQLPLLSTYLLVFQTRCELFHSNQFFPKSSTDLTLFLSLTPLKKK